MILYSTTKQERVGSRFSRGNQVVETGEGHEWRSGGKLTAGSTESARPHSKKKNESKSTSRKKTDWSNPRQSEKRTMKRKKGK